MVSVQPPNNSTFSFKYDPSGRRIQKSGASTTNYVYDGANVIEEVDQNGNLLAKYSQGAGIDEPLSELRSGAISYYEQDGIGSVTSLSGNGGALANTYAYDSFGNLTSASGTVTNPYQYTGRDYDPEIGLRYYRARYYDSTVGRFISEDPIEFAGGMNFYAYAGNDPAGFTDPLGLCPPQKKKKCPLRLNLNFFMPLNPRTTQNVYLTLNQLFGPDIELQFSTADPNANLNIYVGTIVSGDTPMAAGETGANPTGPDGLPMNQGIVDLGHILTLQGVHHAGNAALGMAIAQIIAHELGHEMYLPHNPLGGIMAPAMDPFIPNGFANSDLINILNRCKFLNHIP
jgi:RHS repeat-associated protein